MKLFGKEISSNFLSILLFAALAFVIGLGVGRSTHPLERTVRRARNIASQSDEAKVEALDLLTTARELTEGALFAAEIDNSIQFISLALGEVYLEYEMWTKATQYLEMSREIVPSDFAVNYGLGVAYASLYNLSESGSMGKQDLMDNAVTSLENALQASPDDADTHYLLGMLYWYDGQSSAALAQFNAVLDEFPEDVPSLMAAARIYFEQEDYESAKSIYLQLENALSVDDSRFNTVQENLEVLNAAILEGGS